LFEAWGGEAPPPGFETPVFATCGGPKVVNAPSPETPLRPLGLGEVLDRAVNLCVKYFVPLTLIFLVYAIPLGVLQFFALPHDLSKFIAVMTAQMQGKGDQAEMTRQLSDSSGLSPWFLLVYLMLFFVYPLPLAALIAATAGFYLQKPQTFGESYRIALSRWGHLIGINFMYGFAGGFVYFIVVLLIFILGLGVALLYSASSAAGIAVGVILGTISLVVTLGFVIVAMLAWQISMVSCVIEKLNLAVAFMKGISRVFTGIGLRRSLLVGCAYGAILLGIQMVAGFGELLVIGLLKSDIAGTIYVTVVGVATAAFTTAFITIFYFDLRVREEGLDLQLAAQAAQAATIATV
jgi:hypothetical protein